MYSLFKPILFSVDPEKAHHQSVAALQLGYKTMPWMLRALFQVEHPSLEREVFGLKFKNPVGLAAGFDKNALCFEGMGTLGFGFVEVGTVTPKPQPGNDQPRLFRLPADEALINRMGFNNDGALVIAERLRQRKNKQLIIGGNIGKNKITPNEKAVDDYLFCFDTLFPYVDYFVVNVSSPNTPNLRDLQEKGPLLEILQAIQHRNLSKPSPKPVLLKIAPDLTDSQLDDILDIAATGVIAGLIVSNTTIDRNLTHTAPGTIQAIGAGGLSGKPLFKKSTAVLRYLTVRTTLPIVASGGVMEVTDALAKLEAGAALVQVYTGLIYRGPGFPGAICKALRTKGV